ncbi:MAG: GTPase HflX [Sphaerochaetaceae bacterium]|nr:GTPase HflX [Sphaerochaetaceae bacterium]
MANNNIIDLTDEQSLQKALIIIVEYQHNPCPPEIRKQELESLAKTMNVVVCDSIIINLKKENSQTFLGKGKVLELKEISIDKDIDLLIFEPDLAPSIQRNLEKILDICVIDRREVILQIFSDRASTKEASLQVELARLEYSLPRLTRAWTNLSRQRGGTKGNKGEGEKQLEIDRRLVLSRITKTKEELLKVKKIRDNQRKSRINSNIPTVAIVGYTNSGKSSLLRYLSSSDIFVENKLFATLDTTSKKIKMPSHREMIFSDTVGFVSDLPHDLIESFNSTLEEATYADIILIVLDGSHPNLMGCYKTTKETLKELNCEDKPTLIMLNKCDLEINSFDRARLKALEPTLIETSVKNNINIDKVLTEIENLYSQNVDLSYFEIPNDRQDLIYYAKRNSYVIEIKYEENFVSLKTKIKDQYLGELINYKKSTPIQ